VVEIQRSLASTTRLQLFHMEDIGMHYSLTLREWRRRFLEHLAEIRHWGSTGASCACGTTTWLTAKGRSENAISAMCKLVLSKVASKIQLMNEPAMEPAWQENL